MFYLMRHGEAGWSAASDFDRSLTERGKAQLSAMVALNLQKLLNIRKIICSPYLRTVQSAAIISHSLGGVCVEYDSNITPSNTVSEAIMALEKHWQDDILVVTHQPLIGNLIQYFDDSQGVVSVPPGSLYAYTMAWPGLGCGLLEFELTG